MIKKITYFCILTLLINVSYCQDSNEKVSDGDKAELFYLVSAGIVTLADLGIGALVWKTGDLVGQNGDLIFTYIGGFGGGMAGAIFGYLQNQNNYAIPAIYSVIGIGIGNIIGYAWSNKINSQSELILSPNKIGMRFNQPF